MNFFDQAVVYAVLSLDHFSVGPFLLSRPIVVGPLLDAWGRGGSPSSSGFMSALLLELFWFDIPTRRDKYIDLGLAAGLCAVWGQSSKVASSVFPMAHPYAVAVVGVLVGIPYVYLVRRVDGNFFQWHESLGRRIQDNHGRGLSQAMILTSGVWVVKGVVVFWAAAWAGSAFFNWLLGAMSFPVFQMVQGMFPWMVLAGVAVFVHSFSDRARKCFHDRKTV